MQLPFICEGWDSVVAREVHASYQRPFMSTQHKQPCHTHPYIHVVSEAQLFEIAQALKLPGVKDQRAEWVEPVRIVDRVLKELAVNLWSPCSCCRCCIAARPRPRAVCCCIAAGPRTCAVCCCSAARPSAACYAIGDKCGAAAAGECGA